MPATVAQLAVQVTSNTQQAEAALIGLTTVMKGVGFEALAMVGVVAGIAAIGGISIKMAGDFESATTTLVTGAGEIAGPKGIGMVRTALLAMAVATGTSTQQLIAGMFMIESAGYHGAAGLAVLKAAAEGAKVGAADLGTVADAVTTVMKDYSAQNVSASTATNVLIATVASGKTHMEDLAASIAVVLPVAARFGVSLGDVMGAMATMTSHGIAAANAATYLRQMIVSLEAPTSAGAKALASVGLTAQEVNDSIRNKGLPATLAMIQQRIDDAFGGPTTSKAQQAFKEIAGGSRQMMGMLQLTGPYLAEFTANAGKLGTVAHSTSTTITGWGLVQETFNYKMSVLGETVQTLMIQLGQQLLPVAKQFIDFLTTGAIPTIENFIKFITGSSAAAQILRPVLIVLAAAIAGALVMAFIAWAVAAGAAAIATLAATWPILAAGAALGLLVAALVWAYNHIGIFREGVQGIVRDFKLVPEAFKIIISWVQNLIAALGNLIGELGKVKNAIGNALGGAGNAVGNVLSHIPHFASGGVVSRPTIALVGENEPEVVVPISQLQAGASYQLGLLGRLPGGMPVASGGGVQGGNQMMTLILQVDGTKLAQIVTRYQPGVIRQGLGVRNT